MKQLYCFDFETESDCDLKACGSVVYSHHYSTEIICLCWARIDGKHRGGWTPAAVEPTLVQLLAEDKNVIFMAHNVGFEKAIWRNIMMPRYGFPDIPEDRWHDTMAVCAEKGLPLGMGEAARVLRLPAQKDMGGSKFTIGLSKEKWNKAGYKKVRPEGWRQQVITYCHDDVAAEIDLHNRIKWQEPEERKVWLLDQTINARGVKVDLAFVNQAQKIVHEAIAPLANEFTATTGLKVTQTVKLLSWFQDCGLHIPNMTKGTIDSILGSDEHGHDEDIDWDLFVPDLPADLRRTLKIRQLIGSASIKKLDKMLECTWLSIAYNLLQYHGAGPGRWAGRLLQPQNFPRGSIKLDGKAPSPDTVVDAIMTGDWRYVEMVLGPAVEVVVGALRHALVSRPDKLFIVGDFAGIEARIVLAMAGQHDKTALMAAGFSPYIDIANQIFNRTDITKADVAEYTLGKNTFLGSGFGMGWFKFQQRYARQHPESFCRKVIDVYRKEWAPAVPKLWYGLEDAAVKTVHSGQVHEAYGVEFRLEDGWLTARLPSGRKLWYFDPKATVSHVPWDPDLLKRSYGYGAQKTGHWQRISGYGGLITENVVQALARDLLVHAMFICERENMPIVLTVHDEIVCEVDAGQADEKMLKQIMEDRPQWAIDMQVPVASECWAGDRYRK